MTIDTPAPAEALSREQIEALFLPGDRVRVVSNRQDEEEDYTGHEGLVGAEASPDAQLSVSVILTADPGFGAVLFEPAELELVTPGATRTLFRAALARAEAAEAEVKRLREALEAAIDHWEGKQEVNRRDGDRRASIIYGAVLHRAFDVLNGEEDAALAGSPS